MGLVITKKYLQLPHGILVYQFCTAGFMFRPHLLVTLYYEPMVAKLIVGCASWCLTICNCPGARVRIAIGSGLSHAISHKSQKNVRQSGRQY